MGRLKKQSYAERQCLRFVVFTLVAKQQIVMSNEILSVASFVFWWRFHSFNELIQQVVAVIGEEHTNLVSFKEKSVGGGAEINFCWHVISNDSPSSSFEAVWLWQRVYSPFPSSGHSTLESLSTVICPIVPAIWGDQGWAELLFAFDSPLPCTRARWRPSTCREPERALTVIFCHIQMQQRDLPVSGENSNTGNSFGKWFKFPPWQASCVLRQWQLYSLVALRAC